MFETQVVTVAADPLCSSSERRKLRQMTDQEFLENYASGTCRKATKLGFRTKDFLRSERIAWEFGHGFEALPTTRVTFNDAIAYGDERAITECCWCAERHITLSKSVFPEDVYELKYIHITEELGTEREGIGLILRQTSYSFIPSGFVVLALIAEYDKQKHVFKPAINPS